MSRELARLARDIGKIPKELRKELRPGIRYAAKPVLDQVRRNASWSTRIPKATRVSITFAKKDPGAKIVVNVKKAPHARHYENRGRRGTVRHPVYADRSKPRSDWTWVDQQARPFAGPAVRQKRPEVEKRIERIVTVTIRAAGFR